MEPKLAHTIKVLVNQFGILMKTKITDPNEYWVNSTLFLEQVRILAQHHRNWNPVLGEPDGLYDYEAEEELPEGWRKPSVDEDDLTPVERVINEIIYETANAKLKEPTMDSLSSISRLEGHVFDLSTYHPDYDEDRMEIKG